MVMQQTAAMSACALAPLLMLTNINNASHNSNSRLDGCGCVARSWRFDVLQLREGFTRRHHGTVVCLETSAIDMGRVIEGCVVVTRSNIKPRTIDTLPPTVRHNYFKSVGQAREVLMTVHLGNGVPAERRCRLWYMDCFILFKTQE